jgi:hypothetical protein
MSNKNYNKTIAALWTTKNGNFLSMEVDQRTYDQIQEFAKSVEIGSKLIVKRLSDETREKFKGGTGKAPNAFLEMMSAASVAEYKANNPRQRNNDQGGL